MKGGDSGSQEKATLTRVTFTTCPVFDVYDDPAPEFDAPSYCKDSVTGLLRGVRAGWMRSELRPPSSGQSEDIVGRTEAFARRAGTFGDKKDIRI